MDYPEVRDRLTAEARALLDRVVRAHHSATGNRVFIPVNASGNRMLRFQGTPKQIIEHVDPAALQDLVEFRLLQTSGTRPTHRLGGEGLAFHRWLMAEEGEAVTQAEHHIRQLIDGEQYRQDHPGAAHHLREAFELVWADRTDEQTVSEVGDHLRHALMDATTDMLGGGPKTEEPIKRLRSWLTNEAPVGKREARVLTALVELADAVLSLDQRLDHIRDETEKALPLRGWDEVRRAAFITSMVCAELANLGDDSGASG